MAAPALVRVNEQTETALAESRRADCRKCIHFKVCTIARNFGPMILQLFPKDAFTGESWDEAVPIGPNDIARVCKEYVAKNSVITT